MTEQLLSQQLESPSGTGRVEPRSQISLPARTSNKRGCKPHTHSHWQICTDYLGRSAGGRVCHTRAPLRSVIEV